MKSPFLLLSCLLVGTPALANEPQPKQPQASARKGTRTSAAAALPGATAHQPLPCQDVAPERTVWPQGTLLWGTERKLATSETSSVLASVNLGGVRLGDTVLKGGLRLEDGRLVAPSQAPEGLIGAVLQGASSDGQPVEVALCGAEPSRQDPTQVWYRIQVWKAESASWENPCIATGRAPTPRALAVRGVWDEKGARHEEPGKFTFACENGAIAKCVDWGYKPWAKKDGHSLADLHQACTRMARADYCGDGRSHTREDNPIDMYDGLAVLTRATEASAGWSFEAAWSPEGALCLARTRDGRAVDEVMKECPGRFEAAAKELGEGDRCTVVRKGASAGAALLRNHSYGKGESASTKVETSP